MMKQAKGFVIALFWGSLWGVTGASFGYLTHLVPAIAGLTGFIMFPIGFFYMNFAYREYGKWPVIMGTALTAASIKLVDLMLPGFSALDAVNIALFIMFEAIAVILVSRLLEVPPSQFRFFDILLISTSWRAVFTGYAFFMSAISINIGFTGMGFIAIGLRFLVLEPVVNSIIIYAFLAKSAVRESRQSSRPLKLQAGAISALALLCIAVLVRIGSGILLT